MQSTKQRLRPLSVPWMVCPSTPFLELHFRETDADEGTYVQFVAYNKICDHREADAAERTVVAAYPPAFRPQVDSPAGPYQLMRLQFQHATAVRVSPAFSDTQILDESEFDWSLVPGAWKPGQDIFEHLEQEERRWRESGICQNPRVYELDGSNWLATSGLNEEGSTQWHHFLLLGHDCYVEIIAMGVEIQPGQILEGW